MRMRSKTITMVVALLCFLIASVAYALPTPITVIMPAWQGIPNTWPISYTLTPHTFEGLTSLPAYNPYTDPTGELQILDSPTGTVASLYNWVQDIGNYNFEAYGNYIVAGNNYFDIKNQNPGTNGFDCSGFYLTTNYFNTPYNFDIEIDALSGTGLTSSTSITDTTNRLEVYIDTHLIPDISEIIIKTSDPLVHIGLDNIGGGGGTPTPVPEPASIMLLGLGLIGLGSAGRKLAIKRA